MNTLPQMQIYPKELCPKAFANDVEASSNLSDSRTKPHESAPRSMAWPFPPGEECFVAWRKAISSLVDGSVPADTDLASFDFHGCTWQLPQAFLHVNGGSAMTLSRPQHVIDDRPISQMALYLVIGGSITTDYDGLIQNHEPGDIVAIDYSLPYESHTSGYEGITITFDKSSAPAGLQRNIHGSVLLANSSASALLGVQIKSLVNHINGLTIEQAQSAVDGILRFAETAFPALATKVKSDNSSLFQLASQTARPRLSDPDFGPGQLATALNISRSKLFRLFEAHGGVQRWLLAERLRASLRSIIASAGRLKISTIARKHGFRSEAHFSRAFQKRYQTSPSQVIALATDSTGSTLYLSWLKNNAKKEGATIEAWLESARA
jgi:AraC-like DNA-binding protein